MIVNIGVLNLIRRTFALVAAGCALCAGTALVVCLAAHREHQRQEAFKRADDAPERTASHAR